jgi:glycerophosphoryl diester phosphodiesterase
MSARRLGTAATLAAAVAWPALAFDLEGHRGARGLAPENTMAAFQRALAIGVTTIETDLAVTKDGALVLSHDPSLNPDLVRGPDGAWLAAKGPPINTLTLSELTRYDVGRINPASAYARQFPEQQPADGQQIPTLADLFALGAGKAVRFNIETKLTPTNPAETPDPATFARLTVEVVRNVGVADRVTVQSFDWRTLAEVKKIAPEIATSCLTIESASDDTVQRGAAAGSRWHAGLKLADHGQSLPRLVKAAGCGTWSMFWRNLTPELVKEAQALGLKVLPWTVNDPADMTRLVEWRVDGIITDYPDRLRKVMAAKGLPLPPGEGE